MRDRTKECTIEALEEIYFWREANILLWYQLARKKYHVINANIKNVNPTPEGALKTGHSALKMECTKRRPEESGREPPPAQRTCFCVLGRGRGRCIATETAHPCLGELSFSIHCVALEAVWESSFWELQKILFMASIYLQQLRDAPGFSYIIFDSVVYTRIVYGCLQNATRTPASGTKSTFMGFKAYLP